MVLCIPSKFWHKLLKLLFKNVIANKGLNTINMNFTWIGNNWLKLWTVFIYNWDYMFCTLTLYTEQSPRRWASGHTREGKLGPVLFLTIGLTTKDWDEDDIQYLSLTSARFISRWALASLTASLHACTASLFSSQVTCPCFQLMYTPFLCLSFATSSVFIHAGLLACLPDF